MRKLLIGLCASIVVLLVGCEAMVWLLNLRTRHRAEELLSAVKSLRLGESTLENTAAFRARFGLNLVPPDHLVFPSGSEQRYSVLFVSQPLNAFQVEHSRLWNWGWGPRGTSVEVRYREGKLFEVRYTISTLVLADTGEMTGIGAGFYLQEEVRHGGHPDYSIGIDRKPVAILTRRMLVKVTPRANDKERKEALDFDFVCMSSLRGCMGACEIMPAAWKELVRRSKEEQGELPAEELKNPKCSVH
jgi:hypothetical protein